MRYRIFLIIALIIILVPAVSASDELIIIHTNDVHARYADNLGYANASDIVNDYRKNYENVLLLDAGDTLSGKPEAGISKGESAVEIMNVMGYDAMTAGNHEYDYNLDVLLKRAEEMNFPILAANVFYKNSGEPVFEDNTIIEKGNWKIGVFGIATPNTVETSTYGREMPIDFASGEELYSIAQAQINELKNSGCNFIICISHLGMSESDYPDTSVELLNHTTGIDLCVDGHSHTTLENGYTAGDSLIVSTGCYLNAVGVVKVTPDKKITAELIDSHEGSDSKVAEIVNKALEDAEESYKQVIGYSEVFLNGNRNPGVRTEETNLGDFASDALQYFAKIKGFESDAAIINGGGLRSSVLKGDVTLYDLMNLDPFGNTFAVISVDGETLLKVLEDNTAVTPEESGGFPQVSGLKYSIDTSKEYVEGEINRVKILSAGAEEFDEDKFYRIAVNSFIASGGDKYAPFASAEVICDQKITITEVYTDYIACGLDGVIGKYYSQPQNRIIIQSSPMNLFSGKLNGRYSFEEISKMIRVTA
ncbi:MAG: bifunctional UDP-sugar hydrolase/5'-nucleotidase [Methanocorpusculum sp.]|nr:bifunctional UDP-sugar hydrolase/5'-nucleotidase [Methanocorpusculum sp.]